MKTRIAALVVIGLLTAACSTTMTTPRRQFDDIPLPAGLTYQEDGSIMIESMPEQWSRWPSVSPAGPAPMMATCVRVRACPVTPTKLADGVPWPSEGCGPATAHQFPKPGRRARLQVLDRGACAELRHKRLRESRRT